MHPPAPAVTPRRLARLLALAGLVLTLTLLVSCASTPYTGRQRVLFTGEDQELALGSELYQEELAERQVLQGPQAQRVRYVGQRVAQQCGRPDWAWEFNLIDDEQANAFCLPGGKVAVHTGLLEVTRNDDQLAAAIGHEVAHAVLRHGGERMSQSILAEGVVTVAAILTSRDPDTRNTLRKSYGLLGKGVLFKYSREHELEADQVGMRFMAAAGYDPRAAVDLWRNMQETSGPEPPAWLSTHPTSARRIEAIEAYLPEVMPLYEQARRSQLPR